MLKLIKYYPVNWVDGMKLNKDHFALSESALLDAVRDANNLHINSFNFGLLTPAPLDKSIDYVIDIDRTGLLRVKLKNCRAITASGARIEIINIEGQKFHASIGELNTEFNFLNHNGKNLFVVISVNPFDRDPFGEPESTEQPPRYPHTIPRYQLDVIPQDQFTEVGPFHIPIAKLTVQNNTAQIIDSYIPPVTSVLSSAALTQLYNETDVFLSTTETHTGTILQKIYAKKQTNQLADVAEYLCDKMMMWMSTHIMEVRWALADMPPLFMIARIASLARVMKNALEMRSGSGREEFLNYLTEWDEFNLQQGEFEALLNDLVHLEYDHLDINNSVVKVKKFQAVLLQVFTKLSKLDYIGKKEDPGIIVRTVSAKDAEKKAGGSSKGSIWLE
ncbi:MAG: hypothetical protein ACKVOR_02005 [Flavobacteriales bacterium]